MNPHHLFSFFHSLVTLSVTQDSFSEFDEIHTSDELRYAMARWTKTQAAFLHCSCLTQIPSDMTQSWKSARNLQAEAGNFPFCTIDPNMGKAKACWRCCMSQTVGYA